MVQKATCYYTYIQFYFYRVKVQEMYNCEMNKHYVLDEIIK